MPGKIFVLAPNDEQLHAFETAASDDPQITWVNSTQTIEEQAAQL